MTGQSIEDSRRIQWANTYRYSQPILPINNFEPAENGGRLTSSYRLEIEVEARTSDKLGLLLVVSDDVVRSRLNPDPDSDSAVDLDNPFGIVHPYTSRIETWSLQLGAQYNWRLGAGDLSVGAVTGVGRETYTRVYDLITLRNNVYRMNGVSVNESNPVTHWQSSFRLQYTHWISRRFAINAGVQLHTSRYLKGGIETIRGPRYEIEYQEVEGMPVLYNLNYDRTTLTPNPDKYVNSFNRLNFHFGFTSRM
jgi:hypothetical protein